jgi:hypothetical protein
MRGAALQWTLAIVERLRGRPEHARLQFVVADINLDLAAAIPPASVFESRDVALASAARHLVQAVAETSVNGNIFGHCRALLSYARYQRLAGHNTNCMTVIESVLATGLRLGTTCSSAWSVPSSATSWPFRVR